MLDTNSDPVIGAYITVSGSDEHSHPQENGEFRLLTASIGDTLTVSHLLFETVTVVVRDYDYLTIRMNERAFRIDNVVIRPTTNMLSTVAEIDLQTSPVNNSQEVLRKVPGLIIGQHAGGGKAEQIFLRGFDIDHGTDIAINVDGIPANMVSHAHGQGYADLHFLIPETIENIDFGKGPYYADKGNFNTAGYVDFKTRNRLSGNSIAVEAGQFNTLRAVAMLDLYSTEKSSAYVAAEHSMTDGFFESSQNFRRTNVFGKFTTTISPDQFLSISASHFDSEWLASGQIPQRAVDSGLITRFGAIDDTEGGTTGRTNIKLDYSKTVNDKTLIKNSMYYSHYHFQLFSNFTFFAEDPVNGDQIMQMERRDLFGLQSDISHKVSGNLQVKGGVGLRYDMSRDNQLANTLNRTTILNSIRKGDINEANANAYAETVYRTGKWVVTSGLRLDYFDYEYTDENVPTFTTESNTAAILSPKLAITYQYSPHLSLYAKAGQGFHSNDTRVVLERRNQILPAALGADVGATWKPLPRLFANAALWYLHLEQEFVYVGDAGIVELSGPTARQGIDLGLRYQLTDWAFFNTDLNYTYARSLDAPEGEDLIPLAPDFTLTGGLAIDHESGIFGGVRYRHLRDRAANEDFSIVAEGYTVFDANVGYRVGYCTFGVSVENVFNTEWNETQFATESKLAGEAEAVEEIHFTPGSPFFMRGSVKYQF